MLHSVQIVACGLWMAGHALRIRSPPATKDGVNGVIVYKVNTIGDKDDALLHSLCHLNAHFNGEHNYPIVIFGNRPFTQSEKETLLQVAGNSDVTFAESEFYSNFFSHPDGLPVGVTDEVKQSILDRCPKQNDQPLSSDTICDTEIGDWELGYIWMNVWAYHYMWREPALSSYDYYVYVDSDALVMSKWKFDPFEVMRSNNLKFIFNQDAHSEWEPGLEQVTPIAEEVFGDLRGTFFAFNAALNQTVFNDEGEEQLNSWGGWFHGGDLRAFRSEKYHDFTRRVLLSGISHITRLDQQVVMTIGIAKLALRDQIWSLPAHGYPTSMFHNWFFDSSITCRLPDGTVGIVEGTRIDAANEVHDWTEFLELALNGNVINKKGKAFNRKDIKAAKTCHATINKSRSGKGLARLYAHTRWQDKCYEEYFS